MEITEILKTIPPGVISIIGLLMDIAGALLISIEAFGIEKFIDYLEDGVDHHRRRADSHLIASVNTAGVFLLVNITWFTLMLVILKLPLTFSLLLFFMGYFLWKLVIWISEKFKDLIYLIRLRNKDKGCLFHLITFPYLLIWATTYAVASLNAIAVRFFIDLPFRYLSEKLIAKCVLFIFRYSYKHLKTMKNDLIKRPVFLGALLLIAGFTYQIIGTILSVAR